MTHARLAPEGPSRIEDLRPPFSNFQFVDGLLSGSGYSAIRRLFSLARRKGGRTLLLEDIEPVAAVADENSELSALFPGYRCTGLKRLSFWNRPCPARSTLEDLDDTALLGYAIIKQDVIPEQPARWHVFESVFRKYAHEHNCIPGEGAFTARCGARTFRLPGVMYCQQNGLNKACAQVALRTLLTRLLPDRDIPYGEINRAARLTAPDFAPGEGLDTSQIRAVLDSYGINYDDLDYTAADAPDTSQALPYSRLLYSGIENGLGGLLGFELAGPGAHGEKHIIPFYGHTFNQDTWVPRANVAYFHVGDRTRYMSSEEWVSSFIGHDDNFGSDYCVPRRFLDASQVKYVVALRPQATEYGALQAEAIAVDCLYSTLEAMSGREGYWEKRLIHHISEQEVVLRTIYLTREQYAAHLRESRDWEGQPENPAILNAFLQWLPEHLWMAEVSIPELFPANYRKLGEIILDARVSLEPYPPQEPLWVVARFPGLYLINQSPMEGPATFIPIVSGMGSHISLYGSASAADSARRACT